MNSASMNLAEREIRSLIRAKGAITIAEYMQIALFGRAGYYSGGKDAPAPMGGEGDFLTAPEISQVFGELIGALAIENWRRMGRPDPFRLIELGPGTGALMADILRIAGKVAPDFLGALRIDLVEIHAGLRPLQAARLMSAAPQSAQPLWHRDFAEIPPGPAILIANEFFDCLPLRQFAMTESGWQERMVTLIEDRLHFALASPGPEIGGIAPGSYPVGAIVELSLAAQDYAARIARRLVEQGGFALIIDYGDAGSFGDSFQALARHRKVSPLISPGAVDLTAHVDFAALAIRAAREGARIFGPRPQRDFLLALGIEARQARLARDLAADQRAILERQIERLIGPEEMGTLFKALAIAAPDCEIMPGFS